MQSLRAVEIQTHLGEILDQVEEGERVAIMRDGRHIATIIPAESDASAQTEGSREMLTGQVHSFNPIERKIRETKAFEGVLALREQIMREGKGLTLSEILSARDEGRR